MSSIRVERAKRDTQDPYSATHWRARAMWGGTVAEDAFGETIETALHDLALKLADRLHKVGL